MVEFAGALTLLTIGYFLGRGSSVRELQGQYDQMLGLLEQKHDELMKAYLDIKTRLDFEVLERKDVTRALVGLKRHVEGLPEALPFDNKGEEIGDPPDDLVAFCNLWPDGYRMLDEAKAKVRAGSTWDQVLYELEASMKELNEVVKGIG